MQFDATFRRRVTWLVAAAAALAIYFVLGPQIPKDQVVHIVLGEAAPSLEEVRVRYAWAGGAAGGKPGESAEDWTREARFRYAWKSAPRVITHEPRLPDGDYVVEIDLVSSPDADGGPSPHATARQRVALRGGGATTIDVAREVLP